MELLLNKLMVLLDGETDVFRCLLTVVQKEKEAIVESDINGLNEVGKKKENLLLKIRILEERRIQIINKLSDSTGHEFKELTLNKLSKLVKEPYSSAFKDRYSTLSALVETIREVNQGNRFLMEHSLNVVKSSLKLLDNLITPNPVYYDTGMIMKKSQNTRVCSVTI